MSANSNDEQDELAEGGAKLRAKKRRILIWLLVWAAVIGIATWFEDETQADPLLDFVMGLPFVVLGIYWCRTDAVERDHYIGVPMSACLILCFALGLPLYLFQTRGLKAFISVGWLLMFLAAMCASLFAGAVAASVAASGQLTL